jgi:hypothetical protein
MVLNGKGKKELQGSMDVANSSLNTYAGVNRLFQNHLQKHIIIDMGSC